MSKLLTNDYAALLTGIKVAYSPHAKLQPLVREIGGSHNLMILERSTGSI